VGAVRLLRLRGLDNQFSGAVGDALALADVLPRDVDDRDLRGDIALAESLLDDIGRLVPPDTRP
ncbi:MAG: histidine ammonia-lyase, partial [Mycobacterium sp.]|nr:histidine ammonia-lyase [Mycobacterium sp.]